MLLLSNILFAQKQANNWYFGYWAGITFNQSDSCLNPPCVLKNSKMRTAEGCATISDKRGNLLFYTNGVNVWNWEHKLMPNGNNLFGHNSSSQSALIVPKPGDSLIYFIFTLDAWENKDSSKGFNYSVVDMSLDSGKGDITMKNIHLRDNCTEKLTATKHYNCKDVWVVIHEWGSNIFYTYSVTTAGVDPVPVISSSGSKHNNNRDDLNAFDAAGRLKISPNGKKISTTLCGSKILEIFDFNNKNGIVSNCFKFQYEFNGPYGVEFSLNNQIVYLSNNYDPLYQFKIDAVDMSKSTMKIVTNNYTTGLQLGPDGKMYVSLFRNFINIINEPDEEYPDCSYQTDFMDLSNGSLSGFSFPNFITSYFVHNQISLPELKIEIGEEVSIPLNLILNCDCVENYPTYQYIAEIEFDASFFYPFNSPLIKESKVVNGQRILTLEGEFTPESQETILTEIPGLVLLGNGNQTPLKINKFEILNSDISIETQDGSLEIYGVCQPELSQIKLFNPLSIELTPNPAEDKIKLSLRSIIKNDVKISLSNYMGNTVKEYILNVDLLQKSNEAELDVSDLPSGLYFATIRSGGQVQTEKFVVSR